MLLGDPEIAFTNNPDSTEEYHKFFIHVQQYSDQYEVRVTETTGDGDTSPHFQHGGLLYGQWRLSGYMLAGRDIGLEKLIETSNGGGWTSDSPPVEVPTNRLKIQFGEQDRYVEGGVIVTSIQRQMAKNTPHVQLAIAGYWTEEPATHNTTNPHETLGVAP
jgi:hypothetical protein